MSTPLKHTALFEEHLKLGARMVDFGGWEMPVQYTGVMDEHHACRNAAGLFDVSHMGEITVTGPDAEAFVSHIITNDPTKVEIGQAQYTAFCREDGTTVDDLVYYRRGPQDFFLVVNASNTDKDFAHVKAQIKGASQTFNVELTNQSPEYSQIAIQGRIASELLSPLVGMDLGFLKTYRFFEGEICGAKAIIGRTGYTGEDGFEIYLPWANGPELWQALLKAGTPRGLKACGLGARDTLRLEMGYPLYGHELNDQTDPLSAGLGWVTKLGKKEFLGKQALEKIQAAGGPARKLVGLRSEARMIPRQGYPVWANGGKIGELTSGTLSPSLNAPIALGFVSKEFAGIGQALEIEVRGTRHPAQVVKPPFYKRPY